MRDVKDKQEQLIRIGSLMTQIRDADLLMERILKLAREFVNADSGSIYKVEGDYLSFKYSQNETLQKKLPPGKKLIYSSFKVPINNKSISGYVANTGEMLNIADVYNLPDNVPYSFGKEFDKKSNYKTTSMLTIPLKITTNEDQVIGVLQLLNARDNEGKVISFSEEDIPFVQNFANNASLALERADMTRAIILRMIKMAELRDPKETGPHVNRVGAYATELYEAYAKEKGISEIEMETHKDILRVAAMLHDVGKVGITDLILKKKGRLDENEYDTMKEHTRLGARLLYEDSKSKFDEMAAQIALEHHERWDGNGYPGYIDVQTGLPLEGYEKGNGKAIGKKETEISLWGRIVAIADVYDALSRARSYKKAWSQDQVVEELKNQAGKQFDAELIGLFISNIELIQSISQKYPDDDID